MKKLMLSFVLISCSFSFGQTVNVTDVETRITYRTELMNINGKIGFLDDPNLIVETNQKVLDAINTQQAGGLGILKGPKIKEVVDIFGTQMGMIFCLNSSIWWCGVFSASSVGL